MTLSWWPCHKIVSVTFTFLHLQNYCTPCSANHHQLILSRHLCWNRALILFAILIALLANLSFTQAIFPLKFALAQISPLLKKSGWALKIGSFKFQAYFQIEHYWQNIRTLGFGSPPSSSFHFSQFFTPSVSISKVPFYKNCFAQTD